MGIDWKHLKRLQEAEPPLEHLAVCICTQGPEGVILDHDCGRALARMREEEADLLTLLDNGAIPHPEQDRLLERLATIRDRRCDPCC